MATTQVTMLALKARYKENLVFLLLQEGNESKLAHRQQEVESVNTFPALHTLKLYGECLRSSASRLYSISGMFFTIVTITAKTNTNIIAGISMQYHIFGYQCVLLCLPEQEIPCSQYFHYRLTLFNVDGFSTDIGCDLPWQKPFQRSLIQMKM